MKIGVIGAGHVGLVVAAGFADFGNSVVCFDQNLQLLDQLEGGIAPFHEPGLQDVLDRNLASHRLKFCREIAQLVHESQVIFISVGTDPKPDGSVNMDNVLAAAESIGLAMDDYKVIVMKSTVPVGTAAKIRQRITESQPTSVPFDIVSNPEFLREGSALETFMRPDRVVLGMDSERPFPLMKRIYDPLYLIETPIVSTTNETAELIKYASNAFLAMKISFINEVANLSDALGCDVHVVAKAVGLDRRIGPKFLHPGPGYGGSCLPKDTKALLEMSEANAVNMPLLRANIETNEEQPHRVIERIQRHLGPLAGKMFAVLGISYKPNTDDVRQSPAIAICRLLVEMGAILRVHDPVANKKAALLLNSPQVEFCNDSYEAAAAADAVIVLTEWNEFRSMDLQRIYDALAHKLLFDMRNIYDPREAARVGFVYESMGRNILGRIIQSAVPQEVLREPVATA